MITARNSISLSQPISGIRPLYKQYVYVSACCIQYGEGVAAAMKKRSGRVEGLVAELLDTVTDLVEKVKHLQRTLIFVLCVACLLLIVVLAFLFFQIL